MFEGLKKLFPNTTKTLAEIHQARVVRTLARHKDKWLENVKANAPFIKKDVSDLWVDEAFCEGISVSAGPSLSDDLMELRKRRVGRELCCVDASFKYLMEQGITPDYMVTTDSSEKILSMFKGCDTSRTKLILNVIADPKIRQEWKGKIYWFVMMSQVYDMDYSEMVQDMHTRFSGVNGCLVPGYNVSSIAFSFMMAIRNVKKLHLFGHDFCWKEQLYCGGQHENLARERLKNERNAGTVFMVNDTKGTPVLTNLSLKKFAEWHTDAIKSIRNRVVNHTSCSIMQLN